MADIHLNGSQTPNIVLGSNGNGGSAHFNDSSMPKYVGARAEVSRTEEGVRIWLKDYRGETSETIAEAIESITSNEDGSLTFTLPNGETITTESLTGPQGPQGEQGEPGEPGQDGYTPVKGVDYFDGQDGTDGQDGYTPIKGVDYFDGTNGVDGYSPIANVVKAGDTATISITDKNGTTTATITDGTDGQNGYTPIKGVDYFDGEDGQDGEDGEDGVGIASITKTATVGLVDTYTITYTDGTTSTFNVTNGANGSGSVADVWVDGISVLDGDTAKIDLSGKADSSDIPTKVSELSNDSGYITGMTILSYGSSTWSDFITAYNAKKVVYCRASSNSNPASGSQTRLAFMAYVNNAETPTEVEFQYYRSVSSHSDSQQGDQVYVYKLTSGGSWSVTTREAYSKIAVGGDLTKNYSSGTLTISGTIPTVPTDVSAFTNDAGYLTAETDPTVPSWAKEASKPSYSASEISGLIDMFYPVGSYYETSDATFNPNTAWGGTWVLETEGQVHISGSASGTYQISGAPTDTSDGGEKTHLLTANELPKIEGSFDIRPWRSGTTDGATQVNATGVFGRENGSSQTGVQTSGVSATSFKTTLSFGNDQAHNNMQPYIIVNRWHRTA